MMPLIIITMQGIKTFNDSFFILRTFVVNGSEKRSHFFIIKQVPCSNGRLASMHDVHVMHHATGDKRKLVSMAQLSGFLKKLTVGTL